jgi:RNase adaptor protein for sRNA GlmZ degradation
VPFALKNLRWLLDHVTLPVAAPALLGAFDQMTGSEKLHALAAPEGESGKRESEASVPAAAPRGQNLALKISSFSFHRSAPLKDESGHGGGFIFDARALPNPGREERFKCLTGKDAAVIDYLNAQPSVHEFLASATSLVEASVKNYRERGFDSLMVGFGCTGGQHRSVYLAEALARHFRGRQGVDVVLQHVEMEKLGK